ncbi:nitric oxide synthase oxygenase [Streptomyces sp. NPDC005760]|uniref:nitric oxide synthase oxygenase n=1 Tax=Streptomyces sp. NPDC005760 TaxID=3156718 RepID=UPI0033ED33C3
MATTDPGCPSRAGDTPHQHADDGLADPEQAADFIRQFHHEQPEHGSPGPRLRNVLTEIEHTGTYTHTQQELLFGARVAWRNAARCTGRFYWRSLAIRDCRHLNDPEQIAQACFTHLREAHNNGHAHALMTVFPPDKPGSPGPRILNRELASYAGHVAADGSVLGEIRNAGLTATARELGWFPAGGPSRFDLLPLLIQTGPGKPPRLFPHPAETVHEVPLTHPDFGWFGELGLRWYSIIAICNLSLEIGGIRYPSAPQSGWPVETAIGLPLTDSNRYDVLPDVARGMGLDTTRDATLWKDRAAVEVHVALLHSFRSAGFSITDHHTEARRFLIHVEREHAAGRPVPADWSWIVPPISAATTPVFHRYYDPVDPARRPAIVPRTPWHSP